MVAVGGWGVGAGDRKGPKLFALCGRFHIYPQCGDSALAMATEIITQEAETLTHITPD